MKLTDNLFIGDDTFCQPGGSNIAVVHGCKTCHQRILNYKGSLPNTHAYYLVYPQPYNLYLNLIDPPVPLFKIDSFKMFLNWTMQHVEKSRPILIHCNKGDSRAPSLALILLSKGQHLITDESFEAARTEFMEKYLPLYQPGKGIEVFLRECWGEI